MISTTEKKLEIYEKFIDKVKLTIITRRLHGASNEEIISSISESIYELNESLEKIGEV